MTEHDRAELLHGIELLLALGSLTDRQRRAVLLRRMHGLTNREAGERMGVSAQRIDQLDRAALVKLRSELDPAGQRLAA